MTWNRYETDKIDEFTLSLESLALKIAKAAKENSKKYVFSGGMAIEFYVGRITRNHHDVDFHPLRKDVAWWKEWFENSGYTVNKKHDKEAGEVFEVKGIKGELVVDMWPTPLGEDRGEVKIVNYKGVDVCISDPAKVLNEKVRNAKIGKSLRRQDLHDFALLGRVPEYEDMGTETMDKDG